MSRSKIVSVAGGVLAIVAIVLSVNGVSPGKELRKLIKGYGEVFNNRFGLATESNKKGNIYFNFLKNLKLNIIEPLPFKILFRFLIK